MNAKRILAVLISVLMLITVATTATLADVQNDPFDTDKWGEEITTVPTETTTESVVDPSNPDLETTIPTESTTESTEGSTSLIDPSNPDNEPTEPSSPTTMPSQGTTEPTVSTTVPSQGTTESTVAPTYPLDPSNPDNEPIPDGELAITVKNEAGTTIAKVNKFYVGYNKSCERVFSYSYTLSNPNAKVVWESADNSKIQVVSDDGKTIKIKVVSKNPVKDFTDYVAVRCKHNDNVIFELKITYIQLGNIKNVKTVGNKLIWGDVEFAKAYVVYDLTAKTEKIVTKNKFKAKVGHQYQVQAFEESLGVKYYSKKSAKVFCLKTPTVKLSAGKKFIKITAKKVKNANKFQVKYKTGKGKWKTKTFNTKKALNKKIKKLKTGKTYKVQVRVCKNKNSFSNWTKVKKIKVK